VSGNLGAQEAARKHQVDAGVTSMTGKSGKITG